jgi:hypothetical protein
LRFGSDGSLSTIEIVGNSAYEVLDFETLRAVRAVNLTDTPLAFRGTPFDAMLPIVFALEYGE